MTTETGHTTAITARKVIGTKVLDANGTSIGSVEDVVLDKTSNRIMFAVVGFGSFLGMGEKYHPIPWQELNYDESLGGYVVNFSKEQLSTAPADSIESLTRDDGRAFRDRAYSHYRTTPDWR